MDDDLFVTNRVELVRRIGDVRTQIAQVEDKVRDLERARESAKSQRMFGVIGILGGIVLGIVGFAGDTTFLICGGLLLAAGLLATLTQASKVSGIGYRIEAQRQTLAQLKGELAQSQAELVA